MKKHILLVSIGFVFFACSKKSDDPKPLETKTQTTSLTITVKDSLGNAISNAYIGFYADSLSWAKDFYGSSLVTLSEQTNTKGQYFKDNLQPQKYYWIVSKDCYSNRGGKGGVTTKEPLKKGFNNQVDATVYCK